MSVTHVFTQTHTTPGLKEPIVVNGQALIAICASASSQSGNSFAPLVQYQPGGAWYPADLNGDGLSGGPYGRDASGANARSVYKVATVALIHAVRLNIERLAWASISMEVVRMSGASIKQVS